MIGSRLFGKDALGLHQQHQDHKDVNHHVGQARHQHGGKGADHPHQQRTDERALDGAHATDHHHHKTGNQHAFAHARDNRTHGRGDDAGNRGQHDADGKHNGVQGSDVDPQRLDHLPVGFARADQHAQAGFAHHEIQGSGDRDTDHGRKNAIDRVAGVLNRE